MSKVVPPRYPVKKPSKTKTKAADLLLTRDNVDPLSQAQTFLGPYLAPFQTQDKF